MRLAASGVGIDLDGDGEIDNALPGVLNLVNIALPDDLSVNAVNTRLFEMLDTERVILLFDASADGSRLTIDVLPGERDGNGVARPTADAYDNDGAALESLTGRFATEDQFQAGPSPLAVPLVLEEGEPVLRARAEQAWLEGTMDDEGLDAFVAAAFTVDAIMADVVSPLVQNSVDPDDQATTLSTARGIIELAADLDLDGTPALSGAFRLEGEITSW